MPISSGAQSTNSVTAQSRNRCGQPSGDRGELSALALAPLDRSDRRCAFLVCLGHLRQVYDRQWLDPVASKPALNQDLAGVAPLFTHVAASGAGSLRSPLKVVLAAEEAAGILTLRWIAAQEEVELVAVLTATPGEHRPGVVDVARHLGCTLLPSEQVRDPALARWMRSEGVDLLINVHSVHVIHGDVAAAPRIGSFNLHPGPLPGYAGLNAPSWAIFNGEQRHAVTLHWMTVGIDTGAIAYDAWFALDPTATGLSASLQCVRLGLPLIETLVATALADPAAIPARPQDRAKRRYYKKSEVPFDGKLDWHRSAASLDAFIRAANYHPMVSPWGHPTTCLDGIPLGIVAARRTARACDATPGTLATGDAGAIAVATADEWLLLQQIHQAGRVRPAAECLRAGGRLESLRP
jgi:methionyl-tRNA formyltransferase